jgi:VWFA-related protein
MRRIKFFITVFVSVSWVSWISAQEPDFKLNVDVRSVSVSVNVVDSAGRPITRLTRDDFTIFEDGVRQDIKSFDGVEVPYNILMLVDCSQSTEADWPLMGKAIGNFSSELRDIDRVAVSQFGSRVETLMDWQPRSTEFLGVKVKSDSRICAGTDFYGALEVALSRFKSISGRKGIVVLTDGVQTQLPFPQQNIVVAGHAIQRVADSTKDREFQKTLTTIRASEGVFYFVAVNTDLNPDPAPRFFGSTGTSGSSALVYNPNLIYNMQQARARMQQLAEATGGRVVFPKTPADVVPLYQEIARDFGTNYGIWYTPSRPAGDDETKDRKIEVKVRIAGATVRQSRDSYKPLSATR